MSLDIIDAFDNFVVCVNEQLAISAANVEEGEALKEEISTVMQAQKDAAARLTKKDEEIANLVAHVSSLVNISKSNICKQTAELSAQKALQKLQYEANALLSTLKSTERELRAQKSECERLSRSSYQAHREKALLRDESVALQKRCADLEAEILRRSQKPTFQQAQQGGVKRSRG